MVEQTDYFTSTDIVALLKEARIKMVHDFFEMKKKGLEANEITSVLTKEYFL